tara:strand:+ start:1383 stop:1652 length:270 start_codon:yes stop_codon:yes gene_type:complete
MTKTFDDFIDKKRKKLPNRAYELKYPENIDLICDLLKQCHKKRTSTMWSLYSYRSVAEYMYYGLKMQEISLEGLRKAISRIAKANNLEL